jgi:hypothetical protein
MSDLQVAFFDGQITIGARVRAGNRLQVLTATVDPIIDADGRLWIPASGISLGRLDVPAPLVVRAVRGQVDRYIPARLRDLPETAMLMDALEGQAAIVNNPVFRLGDGRRVRVVGIEPRDGRLLLTCRTDSE